MSEQEWVASEFARCRPWIEEALKAHPFHTHDIEHVWQAIESGGCMLWPTPNSVAVVEVVNFPTGVKALHFWLSGGDLRELKATEKAVAEYGKRNGYVAATMTIIRNGWLRAIPGYRKVATQIMKDLR